MLNFLHNQLLQMPRRYKRLIMVFADSLMIPFALWSAFVLRLGMDDASIWQFWGLLVVAPMVCIPGFVRLGLYRAIVRYMGPQAAFAVLKGVTFATVTLMILVLMFRLEGFPRSVFLNFWLLSVLYVGGSRFFARAYFHWLTKSYSDRKLVGIYGAGQVGVQLATALRDGGEYLPVAFFDDDPSQAGSILNGIQVYSSGRLEKVVESQAISEILLALPSIGARERQQILNRLEPLPVHVRTVPSLPDLLSGKLRLEQVREIDIEDLLGREAVPPVKALLEKCV